MSSGFTIEGSRRCPLRRRRIFTFWSLGFNSALALLLTSLTIRGDTAYYALMLLPVLEAAFRLGFGAHDRGGRFWRISSAFSAPMG